MTEADQMEDRLRRGLAELVGDKPELGPIDLNEVRSSRTPTWRWLLVAAAVLVVAGVGVAAWFGTLQGQRGVVAGPDPTPTSALVGTRWLATHLRDQPAIVSQSGRAPTLVLDSGDRISGSDSCNGIGGTYRLDGADLRLSGLVATQMACGDTDQVRQQSRYLRLLEKTTQLRLDGQTLTLLDASGATTLRFKAADEPSPAPATTVQIRVRNDSAVDFDQVFVNFPEPDVDYGSVRSGETSGFREVEEAYSYSPARVRLADGRGVRLQIIDYLGETLLPPGRYTYVLTLDQSGTEPRLGLRLEADQ